MWRLGDGDLSYKSYRPSSDALNNYVINKIGIYLVSRFGRAFKLFAGIANRLKYENNTRLIL